MKEERLSWSLMSHLSIFIKWIRSDDQKNEKFIFRKCSKTCKGLSKKYFIHSVEGEKSTLLTSTDSQVEGQQFTIFEARGLKTF